MDFRRVIAAGWVLTLLSACGPTEVLPALDQANPDFQRRRSEIIGGTVSNGDPAVVALAVGAHGQYQEYCTGTLIGPRTVLTAAHCDFPYGPNYDYYAVFGTYVSSPTLAVPIASFTQHPSYSAQSNEHDIALIRLASPVTNVTPIAINTTQLDSSWIGRTIRHVGFGNTDPSGTGSGTKRTVSYGIREIYQRLIESGDSGKQTCTGDSGGPGFVKPSGSNVEIVAGVVSFGDQYCNQYGFDTNVAYYANWVLNTMASWEGPTCMEDGQCKAGCNPVDPDCVCVDDGTCNPQCYDLDKDPDCPRNCGLDGVCAQDVCPTPDEDCVEEGLACTREEQCMWRVCVSDPQHTGFYCSRPCTTDGHCTNGMECSGGSCIFAQRPTANVGEPCTENTFCTEGVCTGPSHDELRCRIECSGPGTCPGLSQTCVQGITGDAYCAEPTDTVAETNGNSGSVILPKAEVRSKAAASCSSTGGGSLWLALLAVAGLALRGRALRGGSLRRSVAVGAASATLAIAGCGPTGSVEGEGAPELGTGEKEIVGGTVNHGDPEVFMLMIQFSNGTGSGCTATLIGERTLLTAAHCVDPRIGNSTGIQLWAVNETYAYNASHSEFIPVVETRMHPGWNPHASLNDDIAMARLEYAPPGVTPKPWNTQTVSSFGGKSLRAIGYGITSNDDQNSAGVKRQVSLTFRNIDTDHIYLGDGSGKGVCHGDSGGPSFHTFPDGVERVVGVHSYDASGDCVYGADIRVDQYQDFVNTWLGEWEGGSCHQDGMCRNDCPSFDVDCYCADDGVCSAQCPDLSNDPDCPADCGTNGVCSAESCPVPDEDCRDVGDSCQSELQCSARVCLNDPQHPDFYCSRRCTTTAECPAGMECIAGANVCRWMQLPEAGEDESCTPGATRCVAGTECIAVSSGSSRCKIPCSSGLDCPVDYTCGATAGAKYCQPPYSPPIILPAAQAVQPQATGCTAAGGSLPASALMLLGAGLLRRRRG